MLNEIYVYHQRRLYCDAVALDAIAESTGTPVYVYSAARILKNAARLKSAFAPLGAAIHYSLKANANLALIRLLYNAGLGVEAVSAGEIFRAQQAGVAPQHIIFAGVGKTQAELAYALETGVGWFNVESRDELQLLNTLATAQNQTATVALRLNPGIQAQTHRHIATGHFGAKFGMAMDTIAAILAHWGDYPHLHITGLHVHIGSQLETVRETVDAVTMAQALAAPYPEIRTLNIGGGFPVRSAKTDDYPTPEAFAKALVPVLRGWQVIIEPGRAVVADAGLLLVSVLYVKEQGGTRFVITDGSMTELLRPALYEAIHPVLPVHQSYGDNHPAIVAGPVCESADILHRDAQLPALATADRLAIMGTGAYGMVMASNYNMRPRPPEVLVEGNTWRIIRRRESWADLLRQETDQAKL